jgi:hypothetical protein
VLKQLPVIGARASDNQRLPVRWRVFEELRNESYYKNQMAKGKYQKSKMSSRYPAIFAF